MKKILPFWWRVDFLLYHRLPVFPWVAALYHLGSAPANRFCIVSTCWQKGKGKIRFYLGKKTVTKTKGANPQPPPGPAQISPGGVTEELHQLVLSTVEWHHNKKKKYQTV